MLRLLQIELVRKGKEKQNELEALSIAGVSTLTCDMSELTLQLTM